MIGLSFNHSVNGFRSYIRVEGSTWSRAGVLLTSGTNGGTAATWWHRVCARGARKETAAMQGSSPAHSLHYVKVWCDICVKPILICRLCLQLLHVILERALLRIFRKEVTGIVGKHILFTMQMVSVSVLRTVYSTPFLQFGDVTFHTSHSFCC